MDLRTKHMMPELLNFNKGTYISLYMPTHRTHPDNLQDPILFKNLVKKLKQSLLQKHSETEITTLLEPFLALESNKEFWRQTLEGLAVLGTIDTFKTISLPVSLEELTLVSNRFHTKPLRSYLQSVERYNVICLNLHDCQIYEGNRHSLTELELPSDIPKNINEALGYDLNDKHTTIDSYVGVGNQTSEMHHSQGGKSDEADIDTEKFFRFVAKTINDNYSGASSLPLILAALPEHQNLFHKVSNNLSLLPNGIDVNPKSVELDELVKGAWGVMEPYYNNTIDQICDEYNQAKSQGIGSDNISEVATAAAAGKVDTLLIEAELQIPGMIINDSGSIEKGDLANPEADDLLDYMGELVTKMGGKVMIIPHEKMPTKTGVAGLFSY